MMLPGVAQTTFRVPCQWTASGSDPIRNGGALQTQLLFNRSIPASTANRATQVGPPPPVVIEKLARPKPDAQNAVSSPLRFHVLSEERLRDAVRLAKRDLLRWRWESNRSSSQWRQLEEQADGGRGTEHQQDQTASTGKEKAVRVKEGLTCCGAQGLGYTPQELPLSLGVDDGQSPPTRDPGLRSRKPQLSLEIHRLQKELGRFIQRIEQLSDRGGMAKEALEPEDARRAETRRQEHAVRSARIIYVLQRQVKEIQEDLEKLRSQKIKHSKKSRAVDRLAAAHRGAVRAMQALVAQLSDQSECGMPSHYKELGQLIRQLSLCSAKVEAGQGSSVPETAIDILQRLEALDLALSKREKSVMKNSPPVGEKPPRTRRRSTSPFQRPPKHTVRKKVLPDRKKTSSHPPIPGRDQVLRAGLERLIHAGRLGEQGVEQQGVEQQEEAQGLPRPKGILLSKRSTVRGGTPRSGGFQQPTVSSHLKKSPLPQRDAPVPWIPTSPHTSPPHRTAVNKSEPRCLFSAMLPVPASVDQHTVPAEATRPAPDEMRLAQAEALRQAWLDRETTRRLTELNRLSQEEAENIHRLRLEVPSPAHWAESAELELRRRLQPLLDGVAQDGDSGDRKGPSVRHQLSDQPAGQVTASTELLCEAILDDLLKDTAQALWGVEQGRKAEQLAERQLQAPTLESMLLRMEEMERDQEAVRRRFAHVSYTDLRETEQDTGPPRVASGSRPPSPQPIRLTRPVLKQQPTTDILLESPVETGALSETSVADDTPPQTQPTSARGVTVLFLPADVQRSILQYREKYEAYLRLVSHESVGSFDPWAIADSLAEELLAEALGDVAAEFQHACEDYAEAVLTSEFLRDR